MVKECKVLINNDIVTVVKYDDNTSIQFPSIHTKEKTVFINYENGKYSIVDKDFKPKNSKKQVSKKKSSEKKTTIEENAKE